jgi:hypothetical protein
LIVVIQDQNIRNDQANLITSDDVQRQSLMALKNLADFEETLIREAFRGVMDVEEGFIKVRNIFF